MLDSKQGFWQNHTSKQETFDTIHPAVRATATAATTVVTARTVNSDTHTQEFAFVRAVNSRIQTGHG